MLLQHYNFIINFYSSMSRLNRLCAIDTGQRSVLVSTSVNVSENQRFGNRSTTVERCRG